MTWKIMQLFITAAFAATTTALSAQAATVTLLSDTATGAAFPPGATAPSFQNGDFLVQSSQSGPLNDAIEESTLWTHNLSGQFSREIVGIRSATLHLTWRTGNDTPENDILRLRGLAFSGLFAGTTTFGDFSQSFDLLSLATEQSLLLILNDLGADFNFTLGNDSWAYG